MPRPYYTLTPKGWRLINKEGTMIYEPYEDLDAARINRERVKQGIGNDFYDQQAHAVAQCQLGEPKPKEVIVTVLPVHSRLDTPRHLVLD